MKPIALIPFGSDSSCIDILELHANHVVAHHCAEAAQSHGFQFRLLPMRLTDTLCCEGADLVINLCEGEPGQPWGFVEGTRVIEASGVPFTGNSSRCLANCLDKRRMKAVMARRGFPTPRSWSLDRDGLAAIRYPVIVKPVACHGSLLVSCANVCRRRANLENFLEGRNPAEWFAEQFVDGEELSIGIVAGRPVGWIRARFVGRDPLQRIITRDRKWDFSSADATHPPSEVHADFTGPARALAQLASHAFRAVGGTSYGRVDLRLDAKSQPYIIDINPNCYIGDDGIINQIYHRRGVSFQDMLTDVLELSNPRKIKRPAK